ncbi:MerR family transcriptional regulator [Clostridium felsineum]|uniref:Uncharacterized protein n=1 Tax=Clostridium felsineum TaxID=36839 RepID=A0A1S8LF62_9CLOT|nr:MerR family transcriptional regulator [Clostridium felsineum]URZ07388.1 hypothetical protein CLROS_027260 [Clostridium felsineum]URZ12419.1 hypothetical protein CROST_031410 [Clostridium felsineum]
MKINEVMKISGLTRRAVNYYEDEGLIKPAINKINNYREYSMKDVDKLLKIAVLRELDLTVREIKNILEEPEKIKIALTEHLIKLESKISKINRSKKVIEAFIKKFDDSKDMTEELVTLSKCIDMDEKNRSGFMKREILKIFPGDFGKLMFANYSPFLNEPIDTKEKEGAFINLVKFMDEAQEIRYPVGFEKMYEKLTKEEIEKIEITTQKRVEKWISITDEQLLEEKKVLLDFMKKVKHDEKVKDNWKKTFVMDKEIKKQMKNINYHKNFNENLKILSRAYSVYVKNMSRFEKMLNIDINENGDVTYK